MLAMQERHAIDNNTTQSIREVELEKNNFTLEQSSHVLETQLEETQRELQVREYNGDLSCS